MLEHKINKNKFFDFCNGDVKGEDTETLNHFDEHTRYQFTRMLYAYGTGMTGQNPFANDEKVEITADIDSATHTSFYVNGQKAFTAITGMSYLPSEIQTFGTVQQPFKTRGYKPYDPSTNSITIGVGSRFNLGMVFWVNREVTGDREIRTQEDFAAFLKENLGNDVYGYGGAWDQSYVYNELSEFVNLFGGDYYDWENKNTREALSFLHDLTANGEVPISQITDRYEQIEQKFLDGKYGSIFMYSGAINTFECAGAYRMEKIQVAPLPGFRKNATNIATWQYVLNKASEHEKAAIKFLKYAASREGNIAYAECMKRLPARLDVIREEKLDIPGFQVFQDYVNHVELKERPFSSNPMKDISKTGILFQQYVMDQISQDEFCEKMEEMQKNQR